VAQSHSASFWGRKKCLVLAGMTSGINVRATNTEKLNLHKKRNKVAKAKNVAHVQIKKYVASFLQIWPIMRSYLHSERNSE
jgi:hypothetical protein